MQFESSLKPKLIYVFRINDDAHKGCLKVGEATCHEDDVLGFAPCCKALNQAAKARIDQYTQTAGISYELLYTELTLFVRDKHFCSFSGKEVHNVLLRSGIKRKTFDINGQANEWFITDLETVKRAITAVKEGMELIFKKFVDILKKMGVEKIETQDVDFNTDLHEAVALVPGMGDDKKGKVIDCVQTGYTLNSKVIRHAKVAVGQ